MSTMDPGTFADCADRFGADLDRWPEPHRSAALALLDGPAEAADLLAEVRRVDELLSALPRQPAPAYLSSRILASLPKDRWSELADWFRAALWRPALAAAVPLALGFFVGAAPFATSGSTDQHLANSLSLLAFSEQFQEIPDE